MRQPRGWLLERITEMQIALMTLTRLPAGRVLDPAPSMAAAAWAFPIVGTLVGGLGAIGYALALAASLPPTFAALVAIATGIVVTGAIHEDGLADVADGLGGGCDRARKLAIMRDSHVGSYGSLALILSLAMRGVCITMVGTPLAVACAMVALAAASRTAMVVALFAMPPARSEGLGQGACEVDLLRCAISVAFGATMLVALTGAWPLVAIAMIAIGALLGSLAWRHIGGQTGDVLGAIQQLTEIAGWAAIVSWSTGLN